MHQEKNDGLKHRKQVHLTMKMRDLLLIHSKFDWKINQKDRSKKINEDLLDNQLLVLDTNEEDLLLHLMSNGSMEFLNWKYLYFIEKLILLSFIS